MIPILAPVAGLSRTERIVLVVVAVATALAGIAHYAGWASLLAFGLATVALAGLAHVVSFATEQVGEKFGPSVTGVLQSTLGNLPELFVVIFALQQGEVVVAQTSIIGSIFANALLVLGIVIVVGARAAPDGVMRFKSKLPMDTSTLLLLTSFIIVIIGLAHASPPPLTRFIIVIIGLAHASHAPASRHVREISTIGAVALLLVYVSWVV